MNKLITKLLLILFVLSGLFYNAFAQAPEGIVYQAEARDDKGSIIVNENLEVKIIILEDSENGTIVWEGLHNVTTNDYGMFVLVIGTGTNTVGYVFETIEWGSHSHFLNVQVKEFKKKSIFVDMGTTQLLSVPYALHAKTAGIAIIDEVDDADADPVNELITEAALNGNSLEITDAGGTRSVDLSSLSSSWAQNGSNIYFNTGNVGIGTDNPQDILNVAGGNIRIGKLADDDGSTPGYGDRLYFSGGDDWPDWDSDNSDQLWMARFNAADNVSELRVGIGDDNWGDDKFVIGREEYDGTGWAPLMSVLGTGNVGIGTTTPSFNLEVVMDQGIATIAATTYRVGEFSAGQFIGQAARGTKDAPSAVQENDFLASFNGRGYGDTDFSDRPRGRLGFVAAENWTDESQGAYLVLTTTPLGTVSNTERFRITSEGNIGIGTSDPNERLHIAGNMKLEGTFGDQYGDTGSAGQILSSTGTGTEWIAGLNSDDLGWAIAGNDMYSKVSGNIGIGTMSPVSKLEIVANSDNPPFRLTRQEDSNLNAEFEVDSHGNLALHPSGGVLFLVDDDIHMWGADINIMTNVFSVNGDSYFNSGRLGIGTTNPLTRLQVDGNITLAPAGISFSESRFIGQSIASQSTFDANMGFGGMEVENIDVDGDDDSEQQIHFWTHDQGVTSERRMTIDINGNVGIGTITPGEKLHISGNMKLDGTFADEYGNVGLPGQILSSNGTGTKWIPASSGSNDADWTLSGSDMFSAVSGNVGIGTTSPARKLEIVAASDNPQIRLTRMDNSNLYAEFRVDPGGNLHIDPIGGVAYLNDDEIHMWKDGSTLTNFFSVNGSSYINSGNVGIGTDNPLARLHVSGNEGVLFAGEFGSGSIPIEGAGTRLMWYPKKAAFRVGYVDGDLWDDSNIGDNSVAMGYNTKASQTHAISIGNSSAATSYGAISMGSDSWAAGGVLRRNREWQYCGPDLIHCFGFQYNC
ncbi:MAG: hypothetical protein HQ522_19350 [Bacteroidetes bacterium]|nr:hypothetical protein [Bacteroidota bacterium]